VELVAGLGMQFSRSGFACTPAFGRVVGVFDAAYLWHG
jgi:hypothetical protein